MRRAEGTLVEDVDGNVYLDFLSGAGVLSLGHNHPEIVAAVTDQLSVFTHGLDLPTPVKDRFTELQLEMLPENLRQYAIYMLGGVGCIGVLIVLLLFLAVVRFLDTS